MLDNHAISAQSLEIHYGIKGERLQRQYKEKLSNYNTWEQNTHAEEYILNPKNIDERLAIDETALTNGELYTVVSNKAAHGKKGTIVAMIKGTKAEDVINVLIKISKKLRDRVKEINLDMAASMNQIAKPCFGNAIRIIYRFHVQKLAFEAVQEIRIKHRWEAIDKGTQNYQLAKTKGKEFTPQIFSNGDSAKQLLARSRYLLFKTPSKWSDSQKIRAQILFKEFPDIQNAYQLTCGLSDIYNRNIEKGVALTKMARWFNEIELSGFKSFATIRRTFEMHYPNILNFFENRSTNAFAESFNAKIKDFRRNFRGVCDSKFFLFRLNNIFG